MSYARRRLLTLELRNRKKLLTLELRNKEAAHNCLTQEGGCSHLDYATGGERGRGAPPPLKIEKSLNRIVILSPNLNFLSHYITDADTN